MTLPGASGRVRSVSKRLIVDTGCPFELILDEFTLRRFMLKKVEGRPSNFGWLTGYMVRSVIQEIDFDHQIPAFASAAVVKIARDDGFDGLVGKPFLDRFHFNNDNGGEFCLESWERHRSCMVSRAPDRP